MKSEASAGTIYGAHTCSGVVRKRNISQYQQCTRIGEKKSDAPAIVMALVTCCVDVTHYSRSQVRFVAAAARSSVLASRWTRQASVTICCRLSVLIGRHLSVRRRVSPTIVRLTVDCRRVVCPTVDRPTVVASSVRPSTVVASSVQPSTVDRPTVDRHRVICPTVDRRPSSCRLSDRRPSLRRLSNHRPLSHRLSDRRPSSRRLSNRRLSSHRLSVIL